MVLQKRLDYGFNGYHVPHIPRAARSARKRCLFKAKAVNQQVCAFDLLATVAGKLLSEGENYPPSIVEDPICKEEKPIEESSCHERKFIYTELISQAPNSKSCLNELPSSQNGSEKAENFVNDDDDDDGCKLRMGIVSPRKNVDSSRVEDRKHSKLDHDNGTNLSISNSGVASVVNNSVKYPICGDHSPYPVNRENVKFVNRDNDENSSECDETRNKAFRPPLRIGDRRIRNSIASKDEERYNADMKRCNYLERKESLKRERSIRDYPFKKRKLYEFSSASNSDEGVGSDGICSIRENGNNGGVPSSGPVQQQAGVTQTPSSARGESTSFHSKNHKVNLKIKSFRVPELFIEIPESATVGSLKRTVMEAVNAVLGRGLRVGVILQGKKIRDDNKTLLQSGISHDNTMDTLGFALEPSPVQNSIRLCNEDRPIQLLHDSSQSLSRYAPPTSIAWNNVKQGSIDAPPNYSGTNFMESDHDSAASRHDMSLHKTASESKALVPVPNPKPDAFAVVPLRKSKRSESAQRRIRRPFAVAEVEALVQAVEKLGTGRWRDVKLRAFDNAKHRTYVDLKDKWKTLVHTARISPQQRRGEPVPQELLDRVLAAHAYWSQQQAKQQLKAQPNTCLLL